MNELPPHPGQPASARTLLAWILPLALVVCALAISTQSYWIDECGVAYKAAMPTLADFWHKISTEGSADLQQPFHHFFAWGWVKLVGLNEFALRAGNIPFFLLGLIVTISAFRGNPPLCRGIALVVLTSPFVWFYLNEARPYTVQICASLVVFSSIYRLSLGSDTPEGEARWVRLLCFGMVLLATSGMLAMLWLGAYLLGLLLNTPKTRLIHFLRGYGRLWAITALLLLGMGLFYLWTLTIGARATAVGGTDLRNLAFIPFELLGFSGLGPGRLAIRNEGLKAFLPWLPWLGLFGVFVAAVLLAGWRSIASALPLRQRLCWPLAVMLVGGFILLVGVVVHFRVLGRHCTPVLPLMMFVLGAGATKLWDGKRLVGRLAVAGFVVLSLSSCLMVRFGERHAKDDYRGAARWARAALERGETVWWNADREGAAIYNLPATTNLQPNTALWVANPLDGFETNLPAPSLVLASKPDIYDGTGALAGFLKRNDYQAATNFVAFTAWRRPGKQAGDR